MNGFPKITIAMFVFHGIMENTSLLRDGQKIYNKEESENENRKNQLGKFFPHGAYYCIAYCFSEFFVVNTACLFWK